jgi:hypothetical protein
MRRPTPTLLCLLLLACGPKTPRASSAAAVPTAAELFAAHDRATGADQLTAPHTVAVELRTTLQGQGLVTTTRVVVQQPDHLYTTTEIPGLGALSSGYDGQTAWTVHPLTGPAVLTGRERDALLTTIVDMRHLRLSEQYPETGPVESVVFHGERAWTLTATSASGAPATLWFSSDTGLKLGDRTPPGVLGEAELVQRFLAYGEHAGLRMPVRTEQLMGGMALLSELVSYRTDGVDLPDFSPPPSVRALLDQPAP